MPFLQRPDGQQVHVAGDNFTIGSDSECDLSLKDSWVASRHAILQRDGEQWRLATLNLQAVTRLNDDLVESLVLLTDGDTLQLGETLLVWGESEPGQSASVIPFWVPLAVLVVACVGVFAIWAIIQRQESFETTPVTSSSAPTSDRAPLPGELVPYGNVLVGAPMYVVTLPLAEPLSVDPESGYVLAQNAVATITPDVSAPVYRLKVFAPDAGNGADSQIIEEGIEEPTPEPEIVTALGTPMILFADVRGTVTAEAALTATAEIELTGTPIPSGECTQPPKWEVIEIKKGQTLTRIARNRNVTVLELTSANCLLKAKIEVGDKLFVPPR